MYLSFLEIVINNTAFSDLVVENCLVFTISKKFSRLFRWYCSIKNGLVRRNKPSTSCCPRLCYLFLDLASKQNWWLRSGIWKEKVACSKVGVDGSIRVMVYSTNSRDEDAVVLGLVIKSFQI